jgi:hypothetical protein
MIRLSNIEAAIKGILFVRDTALKPTVDFIRLFYENTVQF